MTLTIKNTTDLQVIYSQEVTDKQTSSQYFTFDITLPEGIPDGEYEYALTDGEVTLSTGIMTILGKESAPEQYEKDIQYEQYTN